MNSTAELPLYRAITGRIKSVGKFWIHEGISDEGLTQNGIFCSNLSFAQYGALPNNGKVPGLPIFLNFDEAIGWIKGRHYETMPAIVGGMLPVEYLGEGRMIRLVRNYWNEVEGHVPTPDGIKEHLGGKVKIIGECFLQGVNGTRLDEVLRSHETVYRPNTMQNGKVRVA